MGNVLRGRTAMQTSWMRRCLQDVSRCQRSHLPDAAEAYNRPGG